MRSIFFEMAMDKMGGIKRSHQPMIAYEEYFLWPMVCMTNIQTHYEPSVSLSGSAGTRHVRMSDYMGYYKRLQVSKRASTNDYCSLTEAER